MFSKYATLLAFAASAIAGAIEPGVYKISNVASHSTARSYNPSSPVFVSSTKEYAGPFELVSSGLCLFLGIYFDLSDPNYSGILKTLRMVVTFSKTSACVPMRLLLLL